MIEIVAAALAKTIGLNFDSLPETDETYGSSGIYGKSHYRCLARAAVEAMRDPTEKMIGAYGARSRSSLTNYIRPTSHAEDAALNAWWAFLDAALK